MNYCEKCGETLGTNGHACGKPEQRFAEFRPHRRPFRRKRLFKTTEDLDAEVDRRMAEMKANNLTIWDVL